MRHDTARAKSIARAIVAAKRAFGNECLITGTRPVDGAHIYPRSLYPELVACEYNIVPLSRPCHQYMDARLTIADRVRYLLDHCPYEKYDLLSERLDILDAIMEHL